MSMTRREHYQRAEMILAPVDQRQREGNGLGPMGPDLTALAQVHATLASVPADVTGEVPERRVLGAEVVVPVSEVKRALQELEAQDSVESTRSCASFVWRSLFGEVMP